MDRARSRRAAATACRRPAWKADAAAHAGGSGLLDAPPFAAAMLVAEAFFKFRSFALRHC